MTRVRCAALLVAGLSAACTRGSSPRYALGRAATAAEIAARDVDVAPDGEGLPRGSGTVSEGQAVYASKCAVCHGASGEGKPPQYPALVGRDPRAAQFAFGADPSLKKTIGDYWPYATTVFDYVRRSMPLPAPGSLSSDETYAVTAYLLAANAVIPQAARLDSASLVHVKMPSAGRFVRDDRRGGHEVK